MSVEEPGLVSKAVALLDRVVGVAYASSEDRSNARLLVILNLSYWMSAPVTLAVESALGDVPGLIVNGLIGLASLLTLLLIRAAQLRAAQWVWVLALCLVTNAGAIASGGVVGSMYASNAILVVLGAVFLGRTGVVVVLAFALVAAVAGWALGPSWTESYLTATVIWTVILWTLGFFGLGVVAVGRSRERELEQQAEALQRTLSQLEASQVSRDYLARILGALRELIVVTDADGTIQTVSRSVIDTGWRESDLIGRPLARVLVPNDGKDLAVSRDVEFLREDGSRLPVLVSAGALPDGSRVWAATDVSKLAATTVALRQAHDRARAANAAKSSFLANMSHELRTPLNAIIGYAELIADEVEEEATRDDLGRINDAAHSLLELINGVLDLSKVEAGKVSLHQAYFEIAELVASLGAVMEPIVARRGVDFQVQGDIAGPPVFSDATKLKQVLLNLLSNAAKYTDVGQIVLRVERWERDRLPWIRFIVSDTGVGMDAESLKVVFEPFVQARREEDARQGTGLGLSICRAYVEMMGGQIHGESAMGQGSTFVVELPVERIAALAPTPPSVPHDDEPDHERTRILVIDDDPEFLEFVSRSLLAEDRQVVATADPYEGLRLADRHPADLIILDVSMPELSGWAFAVRLRETRSHEAPVLVISGRDESEVAAALGCAAFVHKPVAVTELQLRVDGLLATLD